ncbi:hypothetical protein AB3M80_02585 [Arthrospira platensis BEA 1257B]
MKIKLKQILRFPDIASIIDEMIKLNNGSISIFDHEGNCLLGNLQPLPTETYPILLHNQSIGWVEGDRQAATVASLLTYLVNREWERKTLAHETLERYKEINLLYRISEKLSAVLDNKSLALLILEEAMQAIRATGGFVMTCNQDNPPNQQCQMIVVSGESSQLSYPLV